MRVSPWNEYQLVKQEVYPEFQLASTKAEASCGCTSFFCFTCASAGANGTSPPRLYPIYHSDTSSDSFTTDSSKGSVIDDAVDEGERKICLKSSLKKPLTGCSSLDKQIVERNDSINELPRHASAITKRRNIQWTDACGKDLVEIMEFERSDEDSSDGDFGHDGDKCHCIIQ